MSYPLKALHPGDYKLKRKGRRKTCLKHLKKKGEKRNRGKENVRGGGEMPQVRFDMICQSKIMQIQPELIRHT